MNKIANDSNASTISFPTIYRLARYSLRKKWFKYPTGSYFTEPYTFFQTKEEALEVIQKNRGVWDDYCIVLSEIPLGVPMRDGDSFSDQIFLPDGTLWSERRYAQAMPWEIPHQYQEIEYDNYIYGKCAFYGRNTEEIRFHRGDIIEIFCYEGCEFWSAGHIELAIVVSEPPTIGEMNTRIDKYLQEEKHLTGDRGFDIGIHFNAREDAYTVIPAYLSINEAIDNLIDYCPTHCAFPPHKNVSSRMRAKLLKHLERCGK